MKHLFTSLALVATLGFIPAASAASNSVQFFDGQRAAYNDSHKTISDAVVDGSIVPDVARIQTVTIDGKKTIVYIAFDRNMVALEQHCVSRKRADGEDAMVCFKNSAKARMYPTISAGL